MKKLRFLAIVLTIFCLFLASIFGEETKKKEKNFEFIPSVSASGNQDHIALDSELISAIRLFLNKKKSFFLFGQFGVMYNLFENQINDEKFNEWQLGFEPLLGFGTKHIRFSGFLNSLNLKMMDTGKLTFTEAGVRFTLVPFKKIRIKGFVTEPISDPRLIGDPIIEEIEYENEEGVFLQKKTTFKFARQEKSFGGNLDLGIGKKIIFGLEGFARNKENYQLGGELQYKISKKKPWVISANAYYTDFQEKNYLYIHNVFPGMFDERMQGWTAKIGISNVGGVGNVDFTNFQSRFDEELYFSPVIWYYNYVNSEPKKISDPYKIEGCDVENGCLDWVGFVCQSGGKTGYDDLIDYGDGTNERRENVGSGSMQLSHHYQPGTYLLVVSGEDALGVIRTFSKQITIKDCSTPKFYTLTVDNCEGATGNPGPGIYTYPAGTVVTYTSKIVGNWTYLIVTIDGLSAPDSGSITMNANHHLERCTRNCEVAEILEFGARPSTIEYNGSTTYYWRVRKWTNLLFDGRNVNDFTHLESGDIWYGEKTFTNITANISKQLLAENSCSSALSPVVTVTVQNCIATEIIEFGVKPTSVEYNGSATWYWRVKNWKTLSLSGENVASLTQLESGNVWYGEKTFSNLTANLTKELIAKNDCPSTAKASATVTIINNQCPTASSSASQGFQLPNSNPATETSWVNANVNPKETWIFLNKDESFTSNCTIAQIDAPVVLIKAGTKYMYYLNVVLGQQLCSYDGKDISHVSYFTCVK